MSEPMTSDDLEDFSVEIADQVKSFLLAVREVARGESPETAVPYLLLEVSQLLLAGGRLGVGGFGGYMIGSCCDICATHVIRPNGGR